jgi:hypothetical protein
MRGCGQRVGVNGHLSPTFRVLRPTCSASPLHPREAPPPTPNRAVAPPRSPTAGRKLSLALSHRPDQEFTPRSPPPGKPASGNAPGRLAPSQTAARAHNQGRSRTAPSSSRAAEASGYHAERGNQEPAAPRTTTIRAGTRRPHFRSILLDNPLIRSHNRSHQHSCLPIWALHSATVTRHSDRFLQARARQEIGSRGF